MGTMQERITTTKKGSITSVQVCDSDGHLMEQHYSHLLILDISAIYLLPTHPCFSMFTGHLCAS
jgi:hypothetical protein